MLARALVLLVVIVGCGRGPPALPCVIRPGAGAGGGGNDSPAGQVGEPIHVLVQLALPLDCDGNPPRLSGVDVTLLDPDNMRVNAVASTPTVTLGTAMTTVTFTPMVPGSFHLTVRFNPDFGSTQVDLNVVGSRDSGSTGGGSGGSGGGSGQLPECEPGTAQTRMCSRAVGHCQAGTQQRVCGGDLLWRAWSTCAGADGGGAIYVPIAEVCGNGIDDDCNGLVDEGCECNPAAPGDGGTVVVTGTITKMKSDQSRCRIYAIDADNVQLMVFDTRTKTLVQSIPLMWPPTDFDISPDGMHIVAGADGGTQLQAIDPDSFAVSTYYLSMTAYSLEVGNDGFVYFAQDFGGTGIAWLDLDSGVTTGYPPPSGGIQEAELELSPDGRLYAGGYELMPGQADLAAYAVDGGSLVGIAETQNAPGGGVPSPLRRMYLSPGGHHLYYGVYQWDALNLNVVLGSVGEAVLVEDQAETFAIGTDHTFDTTVVAPVSRLGHTVDAAALSAHDHEVWLYSGGVLTYQNVAELIPP